MSRGGESRAKPAGVRVCELDPRPLKYFYWEPKDEPDELRLRFPEGSQAHVPSQSLVCSLKAIGCVWRTRPP